MLGHLHRIEGVVEHGEKRGRDLGFPTINQSIEGLMAPRFGVYAVRVEVKDGPHKGAYNGVASLGVRPMFGVNRPIWRPSSLTLKAIFMARVSLPGLFPGSARR